MRKASQCAARPSAAYPPTVFASMLRDKDMALKIAAAWRELHNKNSPVEVIGVRGGAAG